MSNLDDSFAPSHNGPGRQDGRPCRSVAQRTSAAPIHEAGAESGTCRSLAAAILVVEDDIDTANLYSTILRTRFSSVHVVASGGEALSHLRNSTQPTLLIIDVNLPDMSGFKVMQAARSLEHAIAYLLVSANAFSAMAETSVDEVHLQKPLGCQTLLKWTSRLLERLTITEAELAKRPAAIDDLLIGTSEPMIRLKRAIPRLAASRYPLWVHGESGTGKELVAQCLHQTSPRKNAPFIAVNCAAFPEHLIESMLFGHIKGAFSGAVKDKKGFFEAANGGTLFLDEVGDMPLAMQAKLLRVLETGIITPVGSTQNIPVDCRIISACHIDLAVAVDEGRFREDLYYRLNVLSLDIPALRERGDDIWILADHLLEKIARDEGLSPAPLSSEARQRLLQHSWPGNIRELENVLRRAMVMHEGSYVDILDLMLPEISAGADDCISLMPPASGVFFCPGLMTLRELTDAAIEASLRDCQGCIDKAARQLGVAASTLHRRQKKPSL